MARSASNVVTATPPLAAHSCLAACRFAPGRWSRRASSSVCRSTSRVQLMTTLAGQTTRKCVAPLAARWHIAASDCIVLPRPISSPRITRSWTRANFAPKAW